MSTSTRLSRIRCMDCNQDTGARGLNEYPLMLRDEVWLSITAETGGAGVLCRADIVRRLGRPLAADDMALAKRERAVAPAGGAQRLAGTQ